MPLDGSMIMFLTPTSRRPWLAFFGEAQTLHLIVQARSPATIDVDGEPRWRLVDRHSQPKLAVLPAGEPDLPVPSRAGERPCTASSVIKLVGDQIRSTTVDAEPTLSGDPLGGRLVLFEGARPRYISIFRAGPDLSATGFTTSRPRSSWRRATGPCSATHSSAAPRQPVAGRGSTQVVDGLRAAPDRRCADRRAGHDRQRRDNRSASSVQDFFRAAPARVRR